MFSANSSQVSSAANYIEDVFSTWLYTGTGASQTITNGVNLSNTQEEAYIVSGLYTFIVPKNVTSIQAVAIGSGGGNGNATAAPGDGDGGGGGALIWATIPVTPEELLSIRVGQSTLSNGSAGTSSYIYRGGTRLIEANAGTTGFGETGSGGPGGTFIVNTSFISTYGGGNGGNGRAWQDAVGVGGGSAGTYTGNGANGSGTANGTGSNIYGTTVPGGVGTAYGWGRKADDGSTQLGGGGAVRILWGDGRFFPSTNVTTITYSTQGGMVWMKSRSAATDHAIYDTARGATFDIASNTTAAQTTQATGLTAFGAAGFTIGSLAKINTSAATYASWSFRKQAKFFDIVTYTGTGSARTIAHNLGSAPGCIIVRGTSAGTAGYNWRVYHRSLTSAAFTLSLNDTAAQSSQPSIWNSTAPTSTVFSVGTDGSVNGSGDTYVAYLFAHDAGGFGNAGTDNVISCGSFTGTSKVTLGYEPQFFIMKQTNTAGAWYLYDTMRGIFADTSNNNDPYLLANASNAEATGQNFIGIDATGFTPSSAAVGPSDTFIYIAIRRGPMKTPTVGTSVFGLSARTGTGANATVAGGGGKPADAVLIKNRGAAVASLFSSRLTGTGYLVTSTTAAEVAAGTTILQANPWDVMDGVKVGTTSTITNASANTFINYLFRRAPGFFDVVCYTGNGGNLTVNHNLTVAPELLIAKSRSASGGWGVYYNLGASTYNFAWLELPNAGQGPFAYGPSVGADLASKPTASTFSWSGNLSNNLNVTHVAYLFATVAGVSKVGSYTGTGATLAVNCGFTTGAYFVLIKRTDSVGDWYVWDSARGIIAGNDPYIRLNSAAAEVTTTDWVDTASSGFELSNSVGNFANVVGGTYIFLAIA